MIGTAEHRIIFIVTWPVDIPEALILRVLQPLTRRVSFRETRVLSLKKVVTYFFNPDSDFVFICFVLVMK